MHTHIQTCIHTYIHTTRTKKLKSKFSHISITSYAHIHIHTYTYTHIHTYIHTARIKKLKSKFSHTLITSYAHIHIHTYTHTHTYIHSHCQDKEAKVQILTHLDNLVWASKGARSLWDAAKGTLTAKVNGAISKKHAAMGRRCVCVCVCVYIYIYIYIYMIYIYIYIYICIYASMNLCTRL